MARIILTVASFGVIQFGVMSSKDPIGFFSSLFIFVALSSLDFSDRVKLFGRKIDKCAYVVYMVLALPCFFGALGMFTLKEIHNKTHIIFSENMEIESFSIPINYVFIPFYIIILIFTGIAATRPPKKLIQKGEVA